MFNIQSQKDNTAISKDFSEGQIGIELWRRERTLDPEDESQEIKVFMYKNEK